MSDTITIYPLNWLYNAGVVGLLRVLENGNYDVNNCLKVSGEIQLYNLDKIVKDQKKINKFWLSKLGWHWLEESWKDLTNKNSSSDFEIIKEVWGKLFNTLYRGFFNANTQYLYESSKKSKALIEQFNDFILQIIEPINPTQDICCFCNSNNRSFSYKNYFTSEHSRVLGASPGEKGVPNSFWNLNSKSSLRVCDLCSFIILCHHLALIQLYDNSEIFLNAPSFKVMYHLNKFAREVYSKQETKDIRQLLGMSVIEYATKMQASLGIWVGMNIEVVSRHSGKIDFFNLPYEVTQLLVDRNIASLLGQIGEFTVLNFILNQNFSRLLEFGYRLLQIGLKPRVDRKESEKEFINQNLRLEDNRKNPVWVAEQIFKLFAFIEEKQKKEERV